MNLNDLNQLELSERLALFQKCCAATRWFTGVARNAPYHCVDHLNEIARMHWANMEKDDYLEAFDGHPKIGDPDSLKAKYANTHKIASSEQSLVEEASDQVISELANFNQQYEEKFGYIFIVCTTGKTAEEMLDLVKTRLHNTPPEEIHIAAAEQLKILLIRIEKLFE